MYTFGCGKYGRLGTGDEEDRTSPVKLVVKDNVDRNVVFRMVSKMLYNSILFLDTELFKINAYRRVCLYILRSFQHLFWREPVLDCPFLRAILTKHLPGIEHTPERLLD